MTTSSTRRRARGLTAALALTGAAWACGGGGGGGGGDADEGRQIAARSGCAGCHGANGEGGIGPSWIGLAGSQVTLNDATTVTADEAYLINSIKDPGSQIVGGFAVAMPVNDLSDDDVAKIVAYIESLRDAAAPTTGPALPTAPTIPVATPAPGAVPPTPAPGG